MFHPFRESPALRAASVLVTGPSDGVGFQTKSRRKAYRNSSTKLTAVNRLCSRRSHAARRIETCSTARGTPSRDGPGPVPNEVTPKACRNCMVRPTRGNLAGRTERPLPLRRHAALSRRSARAGRGGWTGWWRRSRGWSGRRCRRIRRIGPGSRDHGKPE